MKISPLVGLPGGPIGKMSPEVEADLFRGQRALRRQTVIIDYGVERQGRDGITGPFPGGNPFTRLRQQLGLLSGIISGQKEYYIGVIQFIGES